MTEQLSVESKTTEATLKSDDVTWAGVPFARGARGTISDPKGDTSRRVGVVVLRNETSSKLVTVQVNTPERTLEGSAAFDVLRTVKVAG